MTVELGSGSRVGDYVLEWKLGGGSFGSVWRASQVNTGDVVAVKLLTGAQATGDRAAIRAEVELLAATASSQSRHVVRVLGGGADPVPHIVMEYVDGTDLAALLAERGTLPPNEVVGIGLAITDALQALFEAGIIHRDVKPANVLIDRNHVVKLADFGIAKIVGLETITMTGQLPMTMAYAAPEAWEGSASHESDLYSMGIVLYQCLVGATPFSGNYGALYKAHTSAAPDLDRLPPETPPSLREIIRRCLEKDPAARPPDAPACLELLQRAAAELTAPPSPEPVRFGPWIRRAPHPTQAWAWRCAHELTGEIATVEVHSFDAVIDGDRLRAAVAANPKLVPHGAERLLGTNRLLLRPDEAWRETPPGDFQFWVARDEAPPAPPPSEISIPRLRRAVDDLTTLLAIAAAEGIELSLAAPNLVALPDGAVHLRRPGLVPVPGDPSAEAMGFLRTLPLDEDAGVVVAHSATLDDLRAQLTGPAAPGVGFGVARVEDQAALAAGAGDSTMIGGVHVVPGRRAGTRYDPPTERGVRDADGAAGGDADPPSRGRLGAFAEWPRWRQFFAAAAAAAVVGGLALTALFALSRGGGATHPTATAVVGVLGSDKSPAADGPPTATPDTAHIWVFCATQLAQAVPDPTCILPTAPASQVAAGPVGQLPGAGAPGAAAPAQTGLAGSSAPQPPAPQGSAPVAAVSSPVSWPTPVPTAATSAPPTSTPTVPPLPTATVPPPPTPTTPPPPTPSQGEVGGTLANAWGERFASTIYISACQSPGESPCYQAATSNGSWHVSIPNGVYVVRYAFTSNSAKPFEYYSQGNPGNVSIQSQATTVVVQGNYADNLVAQSTHCVSYDINNDGMISNGDKDILLSHWGSVTPRDPADLNCDGSVGSADLAILLSWWGS